MPLDDADKKFISELIASSLKTANEETVKLINGTVATAIKGLDLEKKLEGVKGDLDKKLEDAKPKADDKGKKSDDKPQAIDDHPEFKKLQAKVREQEEAAARAEADRRANLLRNSVQESLVAGGADAKRVGLAIDGLIARGVVKLDDKGAPKFVMKRSWGEELVDPAAGAKEFLSGSDDGKLLVPPVGTQGTGDRGGQPATTQPSAAPRTKEGAVDWSAIASKAQLVPALASAD